MSLNPLLEQYKRDQGQLCVKRFQKSLNLCHCHHHFLHQCSTFWVIVNFLYWKDLIRCSIKISSQLLAPVSAFWIKRLQVPLEEFTLATDFSAFSKPLLCVPHMLISLMKTLREGNLVFKFALKDFHIYLREFSCHLEIEDFADFLLKNWLTRWILIWSIHAVCLD